MREQLSQRAHARQDTGQSESASPSSIRSPLRWTMAGVVVMIAVALFVALIQTPRVLSAPAEVDAGLPPTAVDAPSITLATYYGGSAEECRSVPCAVAVDKNGDIYVAGTTRSDDFPLTDPYTTTFTPAGGEDIFVIKLAGDTHQVIYSTYLASGVARGVAVNANGEAVVVGYTSSDAFPTTSDAVQASYQGGIDAVVARLSADGSQLLYGSYLGGSKRDEGFDVAVDAQDNILLTGYTGSDDFITANPHQAAFGGDKDAFVAKIAPNGSLSYSTYFGGSDNEEGWGLAVDGDGSAYVTGRSSSDDLAMTPGVIQPTRFSGAGSDAIVVKLSANGALVYSTFFNQKSTNNGVDIAVDPQGNAHVISTHEGVFKLNADASALLYQTEYDIEVNVGGEGGVAVDGDGIAYVTGWRGVGGDKDIVVTVLNRYGRIVYNQATGGSSADHGYAIAVYEDGQGRKKAVVAGDATSSDFPTVDPLQAQLNGPSDLIILEISGLEDIPVNFTFLPTTMR